MGEAQMQLGERELHKIGEYVKTHLPQWMGETGLVSTVEGGENRSTLNKREFDLLERIVRVEDELKNLREVLAERFEAQQKLIETRFASSDEGFEAHQRLIESRFASSDKRFESLQKQIDEGFDHMEKRFEAQQIQIDKRFEAQQIQIDKRFEAHQTQMDRRFSTLQWTVNAGFLILAALIGAPLFL